MSPPLSTVRQIGGGGGGERALFFPKRGLFFVRPPSFVGVCQSVQTREEKWGEGLLRHISLPPPPAKAKEDHHDCV